MPILNKIKPELNDKTKVFTLESFIIPSTTQPKFGENIINDYGLNLQEEDLTKEDIIRLLKLKDKFVGNNVTDDYLFEAFNFKKDNSDVADYFNSYIGSPGYQRIINNQNRWWEQRHPYRKFYDDPDKGTQKWFKVAKRIEPHRYIVNMPTDLSFVSKISDEDQRVMVTGKYNDWGDGYEFSPIFVLGHEYAHGTAPHTVFGSAQFDSKSAQGEALAQNTNTKPGHDSKKKEKHADIWGLKYLLFKEGIYDSRWGRDITIEEIQKLRKKYPNLRPFLQMTDKQIMFQLNHIAMNTNHNKKLLAKKGGRLIPKHQQGARLRHIDQSDTTWGNRGQGNELQSALENGLSWIGDKVINGFDYLDQGLAYITGLIPGGMTADEALQDKKREQLARNSGQAGYINHYGKYEHLPKVGMPLDNIFLSPAGTISHFPGYQLKGLMNGSILGKALSKNGTININSIQAYLKNASAIEKNIISEVLNTKFAGQKNINYADLKKAVQDELITYNRNHNAQSTVPGMSTEDLKVYGGDKLGLIKISKTPDNVGGLVTTYEQKTPVTFNQFTFESPRITKGDNKHYTGSPLGHSRTYTTQNEPDVLHVMESQSDFAQNFKKDAKHLISNHDSPPHYLFGDIFSTTKPTSQYLHQKYLADNYLQRQLQENLKYAAENKYTKMRYPTSETAAKIEGYKKTYPEPEYSILKQKNKAYQQSFKNGAISYDRYLELTDPVIKRLREIQGQGLSYSPKHQTILKKYENFPKMFDKLFKGQEVRTVTDTKGNTWYEVDVPKNYLNMEWQYKSGGKLIKKHTQYGK